MTVKHFPQLSDSGCNAYLIENGGVTVLIDAPDSAVKGVKESGQKLAAVILTHGHFDHISGLREIIKVSGAEVYIHEAEIPMLTDTAFNLADMYYESGSFPVYDGKVNGLKDGDVVNIAGLNFRIFHAPGHTPGLIAVQTDDMIFTGDFIFESSIGNTSFPNSNPQDMAASLKRFVNTFGDKDYTLYPGHGGKTTMFRELNRNPFL
ncbi:MAG: MBL fold metallo-hydrolase [Ruminococcus sp.]|jgi:glyoxylase-like metal-dependent hydrolase (beta-lactamase superfamily II)|nr:MBL fold metallo-hydrolase [Ruminococcus sp.]